MYVYLVTSLLNDTALIEVSEDTQEGFVERLEIKFGHTAADLITQVLLETDDAEEAHQLERLWIVALDKKQARVGSLEHRQKISATWTEKRRKEASKRARKIAKAENEKLRDYVCEICEETFTQITRSQWGGHRRKCLYYTRVEEWNKKQIDKQLDEILDGEAD